MNKRKIGIFIVVIGILIILYPLVSNIIASYTRTVSIIDYEKDLEKYNEEKIQEELEKAQKYNEKLAQDEGMIDEENIENTEAIDYLEVLNLNYKIGIISIPKINVYLPIYHGAGESSLEIGVGHLEHTSFPVGGAGTHAVLSGHSGLVRSKIFDNIHNLEIGDKFYIKCLDKNLTYQVDQIKVVEPDDDAEIRLKKGKDYVTLLTCTPYGVNSHRLLVRGTRVSDEVFPEEPVENSNKVENKKTNSEFVEVNKETLEKRANKYLIGIIIICIIAVVLFIILIYVLLIKDLLNRKKINKEYNYSNVKDGNNNDVEKIGQQYEKGAKIKSRRENKIKLEKRKKENKKRKKGGKHAL